MPSLVGAGWSLFLLFSPEGAFADSKLIDMYIGAGCFWHVQAVVNVAEEEILGRRSSGNVTGLTGYAGGRDNGGDTVCYTDYGRRGHTEVVAVRQVPSDLLEKFADHLWKGLFVNGERSDDVNRGGEYRAALGFSGGLAGDPAMATLWARSGGNAAKLIEGRGDDEDSLGKKEIYVYDSDAFPFHQAELYHQFHDYRGNYREILLKSGVLQDTDCPSEVEAFFYSTTGIVMCCIIGLFVLCCAGCVVCRLRRAHQSSETSKVQEVEARRMRVGGW